MSCAQALQDLHEANSLEFGQSQCIARDISSLARVFKNVECDSKHALLLSLADAPAFKDPLNLCEQAMKNPPAFKWANAKLVPREDTSFSEKSTSPFGEGLMDDEGASQHGHARVPPPPPPHVPSPLQIDNKKGKNVAKKDQFSLGEDSTLTDCGCLACHVGKWAANKYVDEYPEALRHAFLQSINGMESGVEEFMAASKIMPLDFKQAATEVRT